MQTTRKDAGVTKQEIVESYSRHVSAGKVKFFQEAGIDFVFGKREGPYVWDIDGAHRLINCHSNGGVFNLGHRHPEIIQAMRDALDSLDIGNHHFVSEQKAILAQMLAEKSPPGMDCVVFGVSGGESIDTAIKIARKATGRRGIVSAQGGYHGHTGLAIAAGDVRYREPFYASLPDFSQVPFNDANALQQALHDNTAAVLFETIPATLGMPIPDEHFYRQVKAACEKNGSLLIMDEVQTGLGRTGMFWGIEHYRTIPDMIVTAKGLGGGLYPMTAVIVQNELARVFDEDPFAHISTIGGADIGCVVAQKVIEISSQPEFLSHVNALAELFSRGVAGLIAKYSPFLLEFRQKGLMSGLKMARPELGPLMTRTSFDAGLLCIYAGNDPSALQFLPPLNIEFSVAEEILERLDTAFREAVKIVKTDS
jgi:acetylornithine/succinyldiaminopimelate/putrescine aminotransferase